MEVWLHVERKRPAQAGNELDAFYLACDDGSDIIMKAREPNSEPRSFMKHFASNPYSWRFYNIYQDPVMEDEFRDEKAMHVVIMDKFKEEINSRALTRMPNQRLTMKELILNDAVADVSQQWLVERHPSNLITLRSRHGEPVVVDDIWCLTDDGFGLPVFLATRPQTAPTLFYPAFVPPSPSARGQSARIATLEEDCRIKGEQIRTLQEDMERLRGDVAPQDAAWRVAQGQARPAGVPEVKIQNLGEQVEELTRTLREEMDRLRAESVQKEDFDELEREVQQLGERFDGIDDKVAELDGRVGRLENSENHARRTTGTSEAVQVPSRDRKALGVRCSIRDELDSVGMGVSSRPLVGSSLEENPGRRGGVSA